MRCSSKHNCRGPGISSERAQGLQAPDANVGESADGGADLVVGPRQRARGASPSRRRRARRERSVRRPRAAQPRSTRVRNPPPKHPDFVRGGAVPPQGRPARGAEQGRDRRRSGAETYARAGQCAAPCLYGPMRAHSLSLRWCRARATVAAEPARILEVVKRTPVRRSARDKSLLSTVSATWVWSRTPRRRASSTDSTRATRTKKTARGRCYCPAVIVRGFVVETRNQRLVCREDGRDPRRCESGGSPRRSGTRSHQPRDRGESGCQAREPVSTCREEVPADAGKT